VAQRQVAECLDALDAMDVPSAQLQGIGDVLADPQVQARNMVLEQAHPVVGKVRLPNLPCRFSECDTTVTWATAAPMSTRWRRRVSCMPRIRLATGLYSWNEPVSTF
jgi:crotonobetainyl-CoA:carnitine CoA-transferase CaiB-like acyl-CoA transferase